MQTSFSSCAGSSSAARPASKKVRLAATSGGAAGSAEQPATLLAQVEQIGHYPAEASSSAAPPAPRSAAVLHSLHPVLAPMIWQIPELSNRLWDLMRLQDKACSRCTCRFDHQRITTHAFVAQYNYSKGRKLSDMVKDNTCKFDDLTAKDQQLVEDFETRRSAKTLDEVMGQKAFKQQPYRGPGTETTTTHCLT